MVRRELRYDAIAGSFVMEQREEDRITDNYEDDMRAQWIEAEGKRMRADERRHVVDVAAGFVLGVVLIGLVCVVLSGAIR
jgi:hypothetical protein